MWRFLLVLGLLLFARPAQAHPMPNSVVTLHLHAAAYTGEARLPLKELENAMQHPVPDVHVPDVTAYFTRHVRAEGWQTHVDALDLDTQRDPMVGAYQEVIVKFTLTPPTPAALRHFTFAYDAVIHQVITHQILVFLQNDWHAGLVAQDQARPLGTIAVDVRSGQIRPLQVDLAEGSWLTGTFAMFLLGMRHIREGLDHILFLLTLLLVAPLAIEGHQWTGWQGLRYALKRFLTISLAFTVGHSVTLLLGSLVTVQTHWVEVLIALTILVSAINAIYPVFRHREAAIAGGFGLIHGLAFSMALSGMDLDLGSKLLSVLGFNLGIEAMQLILMVAFFPVLLLSKFPVYRGLRTALASTTVVLSLAWIAERVSHHENFITRVVNQFFS